MDRLTFDGNFCDIAQCRELPCQHGGSCTQRKVWEKLKAYEDTGLTPEEVNDAVVGSKLLAKSQLVSAFGVAAERLRELAEAEKDGRLMVLPCKVGDTVYFALLGRVIEKQVFSIVSFSNSTRIYCGGTSEYFRPEDIGKTFFFTREEAEKALEAKKDE